MLPAGSFSSKSINKGAFSYCLACKASCVMCSIWWARSIPVHFDSDFTHKLPAAFLFVPYCFNVQFATTADTNPVTVNTTMNNLGSTSQLYFCLHPMMPGVAHQTETHLPNPLMMTQRRPLAWHPLCQMHWVHRATPLPQSACPRALSILWQRKVLCRSTPWSLQAVYVLLDAGIIAGLRISIPMIYDEFYLH